jgi:hypothetical protein
MIRTAPNSPSAHLVDLRAITMSRPSGPLKKKTRNEQPSLTGVTVPRTISGRPNTARSLDQLTVVAFARFLFAVAKAIVVGAGQLIILPLTLGLALVDRFDPDRLVPELTVRGETIQGENSQGSKRAELAIATEVSPKDRGLALPARRAPRTARKFNMRRALISFAGTALVIILPLQGLNAWRAIETVKAQAENANATALGALNGTSSFAEAQSAITTARQSVNDLGKIANALLANAPSLGGVFRSGKALLDAGSNLATAVTLLSRSLDFVNDPSLDLTEKLARAEDLAEQSQPLLALSQTELASADALPAGVEGNLASLKNKVAAMNDLTNAFLRVAPALRNALGETQTRRYLVIFQNNAELRPTGGFIGSFALVDIDRGAIKTVDVPAGGPYDLEGSLRASVLSPEPLRLVRAKWEFQDANWFPDFPTSAKKLTWFYNQSSGPTVDGVIAINAPVLAELLDTVGPINMPTYGIVATSTSVLQTAQEIVESPAARAGGKPKQFIADLMPLVLQKLMSASGDQAVRIVAIFTKALQQKDIQMAFSDDTTEQAFDSLGWTGRLDPVPQDFDSFELVRANIGGAKTDAVISTKITHESVIATDGSVIDHVTVTLTHNGHKGDAFTGVRNVTYLRLYVPEGSKLIQASGDIRPPAPSFFDIPPEGCAPDQTLAAVEGVVLHDPNSGTAVNNEFGRTVYGVWTQTDPGASSTVSFDYQLPFTVNPVAPAPTLSQQLGIASVAAPSAPFGLIVENQSGAGATEINSTLKLPTGWYPSYASPEGIAATDGWSFTSDLDTTKIIGAIISN